MHKQRKFSPEILPSSICFLGSNGLFRENRLIFANSAGSSGDSEQNLARQKEFIEKIQSENPSSLSTIDKYLIDKEIFTERDFSGKFNVVDFLEYEKTQNVASQAERELLENLKSLSPSSDTLLYKTAIESLVFRRVKSKEATKRKLEQHVANMKAEKQKETLKKMEPGFVEEMKRNWHRMGKSEKFLGVATIAFITVALFTSQKLRRIRDYVLGFATLGGVCLAANAVSKIVSGKGVLDHFDKKIERVDFFEKEFNIDKESAEAFQKGIIYMDSTPMATLIEGYEEAHGQIENLQKTRGLDYVPRSMKYYPESLRVKGMSRKQVYLALDAFFEKYGDAEYMKRKWKPDRLKKMSFKDLAVAEMAGDAKMANGMWEPLGEYVGAGWDSTKEALAAIGVTEITKPVGNYFKGVYRKHQYTFKRIGSGAWHVVEVGIGGSLVWTADKLAALIETNLEKWEIIEIDQQVKEVEATLDYLKKDRNVDSLDEFVKDKEHLGVFQANFERAKNNNNFYKEDDKAFYVIARASLERKRLDVLKGIHDAIDNAKKVAIQQIHSDEYLQAVSGFISGNDYYILMRMPLENNAEYSARKANIWHGGSQMEMKNKPELFDENLWMGAFSTAGIYKDALKAHFRISETDQSDTEYTKLLDYIKKSKKQVGYMPEDVVEELLHLSIVKVNKIAKANNIQQVRGLEGVYRVLDIRVAKTFPYIKEKVREATKDEDSQVYLDDHHLIAKNIWITVENTTVPDWKTKIISETDREKQKKLVEDCLAAILETLGKILYNKEK